MLNQFQIKAFRNCYLCFFNTLHFVPSMCFHFALLFFVAFANVCFSKSICFIASFVSCQIDYGKLYLHFFNGQQFQNKV